MHTDIWISFVGASVVFGLIPGPSVCFTIAYALKHGTRRTLLTILGQLAANCCQIVVVLFGLSTMLERSAAIFYVLKLCGAVYLTYLGIRQWTAGKPGVRIEANTSSQVTRKAFLDGFVVCGTNPKAILYYTALLPQFVVQTGEVQVQMIILAMTSLAVAVVILVFYTMLAGRVRYWFQTNKVWKVQNRIAGIVMIIAGIVMSLASGK